MHISLTRFVGDPLAETTNAYDYSYVYPTDHWPPRALSLSLANVWKLRRQRQQQLLAQMHFRLQLANGAARMRRATDLHSRASPSGMCDSIRHNSATTHSIRATAPNANERPRITTTHTNMAATNRSFFLNTPSPFRSLIRFLLYSVSARARLHCIAAVTHCVSLAESTARVLTRL